MVCGPHSIRRARSGADFLWTVDSSEGLLVLVHVRPVLSRVGVASLPGIKTDVRTTTAARSVPLPPRDTVQLTVTLSDITHLVLAIAH